MTQRTLSSHCQSTIPPGACFAIGSILLLTGLALADRVVAWLIGEFPSAATLWYLRFEFLRPAGAFHDIVVANLGWVSLQQFSLAASFCGLIVALCAASGIRVVRALAYHVLLGAALALTVFSLGPSSGIYTKVGAPSTLYVMIGAVLSASAAILCIGAHAEYVGWTPRYALLQRWMAARVARRFTRLWQDTLPAVGVLQPAPARVHSKRQGAGLQ